MATGQLDQTQPVGAPTGANGRERLLLVLAAAFVIAAGITLHLGYAPFDVSDLSITCAAFLFTFATAHLTLCRHLPSRDPFLLPAGALLSGWGLLMVGRLAPSFLARQVTWLMLGAVAMLAVIALGRDLRWLQRYRYTWLVGGLLLLAATLFLGVNPSGSGPRLWLGLGGAYIQPSEPLKLLMVVFLASYLAERRKLIVSEGRKLGPIRLPPMAYVGPLLVMFGLTALLLGAQQDLGAAMLFFLTFLSMLYLATGQWGYVAAGLALFGGAGATGYAVSSRIALRIRAWLSPWSGAADWSFQVVQSLLAFGTGGVLGEGPGLGRPTYIPAVHTDFTFAAIGESFGLIGLLAVIALYGLLLLRGFRTAANANRVFERYLAAGLTAGLTIQAWVIMGGNVKLAPIAGVTLPFLSYGGSSLLTTFVVLGLLLRISQGTSAWTGFRSAGGAVGGGNRASGRATPDGPLGGPSGSGSRGAAAMLSIERAAAVLVIALGVLALFCGYWAVVRADWLVNREDNPRRVVYERSIIRGRILDRNGEALAAVKVDASGLVTRTYPVSEAAPVVGYATLRYGTGGIEAAFDDRLRGEAGGGTLQRQWADLLHRPPKGGDVQLTLDAELQRRAQDALRGEAGAAVLLEVGTGRVLAMGSSPTFDPAQLAEQWERLRDDASAPLLNRATQGLYQPGSALQTVVVAEALRQDLIDDLAVDVGPALTEQVEVDGVLVGCSAPPQGDPTLASAYAAGCPAPIRMLGEHLGWDGFVRAVEHWRLGVSPPMVIPTEASDLAPSSLSSVQDEALGQGALTVSPLRMALVAATVGNGGAMPEPHLVLRVRDTEGRWHEARGNETSLSTRAVTSSVNTPILSASQARELLSVWHQWDLDSGSAGRRIRAHWGVAVAGEGAPHVWFLGLASAGEPQAGTARPTYAVAVLVEHAEEPQRAVRVGRTLLEAALLAGD